MIKSKIIIPQHFSFNTSKIIIISIINGESVLSKDSNIPVLSSAFCGKHCINWLIICNESVIDVPCDNSRIVVII